MYLVGLHIYIIYDRAYKKTLSNIVLSTNIIANKLKRVDLIVLTSSENPLIGTLLKQVLYSYSKHYFSSLIPVSKIIIKIYNIVISPPDHMGVKHGLLP